MKFFPQKFLKLEYQYQAHATIPGMNVIQSYFYQLLPDRFTRAAAQERGKKEKLSASSVDKYLNYYVENGFVTRDSEQRGLYVKVPQGTISEAPESENK